VVDAPHGMAEWLEERSVSPQAVFVTHQHFDHVQSCAEIAQRWGCPIYAWSAFSRDLTLERLAGRGEIALFHVPEFTVQHVLGEQTALTLLGMDWQLSHVPGHSEDSACLHQKDLGIIFAGDTLMAGGLGRSDFPGGSHTTLVKGITQHIMTLPDATRVLSGHGPETTVGEERQSNPYLR
jgi:hydroxyacylglutathione hydrolase